mmetsp:Transcript_97835/g.219313  ORF Transcript_97835/g.219313 Transcript_97835/m.219313 type:complete len:228 (-) Transcript_97835:421-1104(-)
MAAGESGAAVVRSGSHLADVVLQQQPLPLRKADTTAELGVAGQASVGPRVYPCAQRLADLLRGQGRGVQADLSDLALEPVAVGVIQSSTDEHAACAPRQRQAGIAGANHGAVDEDLCHLPVVGGGEMMPSVGEREVPSHLHDAMPVAIMEPKPQAAVNDVEADLVRSAEDDVLLPPVFVRRLHPDGPSELLEAGNLSNLNVAACTIELERSFLLRYFGNFLRIRLLC